MIRALLAAATPLVKAHAATAAKAHAAVPLPAPKIVFPTQGPLTVPPGANSAQLTAFQQHVPWLTHTLAAFFVIAALALIALLAAQTTKQEGLSGSIGGAVQSAYGRPGAEEQLKRITGVTAVAFVILGTILSLTGI